MRIYAKAIFLLLASAALSVWGQKENSIIPNTPGKEDPGKQDDQKEEEDTYKSALSQRIDNLDNIIKAL